MEFVCYFEKFVKRNREVFQGAERLLEGLGKLLFLLPLGVFLLNLFVISLSLIYLPIGEPFF